MIKKLWVSLLVLAIFLIFTSQSFAREYHDIREKINSEGSANVIIIVPAASYNRNIATKSVPELSIMTVSGKERVLYEEKILPSINGYAGVITREKLAALDNSGMQYRIFEDKILHIMPVDDTDADLNVNPNAGLNSGGIDTQSLDVEESSIGTNYTWNVLNITGRNITVAIIDTGIYNHTDLGGCFGPECKIIGGYNFVSNNGNFLDDNGHGTHVAGILSANGTIKGVAPDSRLLAVKAMDETGSGSMSNIILAIDWAMMNNASIISMSIGESFSADPYGNSGFDPLSMEVENATSQGIIVVISAGNLGSGISTIAIPAAARDAITVGSVTDRGTQDPGDDLVSSFSSRGPSAFGRLDPDVVAPGEGITSTRATGLCLFGCTCNGDYMTCSGTSMSAPAVAGAAALLLEHDKTLTPAKIRSLLMSTASNVSGRLFDVGAGEINVKNAIMYNISANISGKDSYGQNVVNDRWEFVATPIINNTFDSANISIRNNDAYNITFNITISNITDMENSNQLDSVFLQHLGNITVADYGSAVFGINFSIANFSNFYVTTYGGFIRLSGIMDNGTENITKNITIPFVVTIPFTNLTSVQRNVSDHGHPTVYPNLFGIYGDVLFYAHIHTSVSNNSYNINWTSSSDDLDLYLYNSTGDIDLFAGQFSTTSEHTTAFQHDTLNWFRVHAFNLSAGAMSFDITINNRSNHAPIITNVTTIYNGTDLTYILGSNITIKINYSDQENDNVTPTLSDDQERTYTLTSEGVGYFIYSTPTNASMLENSAQGNYTLNITLKDDYSWQTSRLVTITVVNQSILEILNYTPANLNPISRRNNTIFFAEESIDSFNNPIYYFWYVDGILNATTQNLTYDFSDIATNYSEIKSIVSNNVTNLSISWNVTLDDIPPTINITSPQNQSYNTTTLSLNFTAQDPSGIDRCWYILNNGSITSVANCNSTTLSVNPGNNTLIVFANDSAGNIGSANITFIGVDITAPVISITSPISLSTYNFSGIDINFTSTDQTAVDRCWYSVNGTTNITNTTIACTSGQNISARIYLINGNYTLSIYSNDTLNNSASSTRTFKINDLAFPKMSGLGPYVNRSFSITNVTLTVTTDESATCKYDDSSDGTFSELHSSFVDQSTAHTVLYLVDPSSSYTIYVRCRDLSGNSDNESGIITFSVAAIPPHDGGGGGGGSGSGGSSGFVPDPAISSIYPTLHNGTTNMTFSDSTIILTGLDLDTYDDVSNVKFTISQPRDPIATYSSEIVYRYFDIAHDNLNDTNVKNVLLAFSVNKTWLDVNAISKNDIVLLRYSLLWARLPTKLVSEDSMNYYYQAESPGLSLYAVSYNRPPMVPLIISSPNISQDAGNDTVNFLIEKNFTQKNIKNESSGTSTNSAMNNIKTFGIGLLIVAMIGLIVVSIVRRKYSATSQMTKAQITAKYREEGNKVRQRYDKIIEELYDKNPIDPKIAMLKQEYSQKILMVRDKYKKLLDEMKEQTE